MAAEIILTRSKKEPKQIIVSSKSRLVTPGDTITSGAGFMRGHGTYVEDDELLASVAGIVEKVNRLVSVRPLKTRYNGEIGDVVIGRIIEVQQKRWTVEANSRLNSTLMLSAVNLPGGELRIRGAEDELMMRQYLQEGDLISLSQGTLIRVSPSLIKRRKTHFHNLPCGASIILGNNGFVWIAPTVNDEMEDTCGLAASVGKGSGGYVVNLEPVPLPERETIAMLRNCILALAAHKMMLFDTSILYAFDMAQKYRIKDLLKPDVMEEVAELTKDRLKLESGEEMRVDDQ